MANTLTFTSLAPEIYKAMDIIGRELTGVLPSVMLNTSSSDGVNQASYGDNVQSFRTAEPTVATTYTPAMVVADGTDQTVATDTFALNKVARVDVPVTGETEKRLNNSFGAETVRAQLFAQMIRAVTNAIETEACSTIYKYASRAYGTAGTTPFASNFDDIAQIRKILADNGCPMDNQVSLILNTAAGAKLRSLAQLQKANEAGGSELLRRGTLLDLQGLMIKESAKIASHTKGAGTGYDVDLGAGYAIGDTTIHLDGGTVNTTGIKAGDVITFAGDTNKYVVNNGTTAVEADIVLNRPGLRASLADAVEATVGDSYTANLAFHRNAVEVAVRAPSVPSNTLITDELSIVDPITGIPYVFRQYGGYGMVKWELVVFYGVKVWKEEFVATLLG